MNHIPRPSDNPPAAHTALVLAVHTAGLFDHAVALGHLPLLLTGHDGELTDRQHRAVEKTHLALDRAQHRLKWPAA